MPVIATFSVVTFITAWNLYLWPQVIATDCQRTGGGVTVRLPATGGHLGEHPDQVAALVNQAFTAVG